MASIMRQLKKALDSAKDLTNKAFKVGGNNGLYIALAILVVVLLIVIIPSAVAANAANAANASNALVATPDVPVSLTLTWRNASGSASFPLYVPENSVYVKQDDVSLNLPTYSASFNEAFGSLVCMQVYRNMSYNYLAFVKYSDAGVNRFALLIYLDSGNTISVYTTEDVGSSTDPSTYQGMWTYEYDSKINSYETSIEVSSTFAANV